MNQDSFSGSTVRRLRDRLRESTALAILNAAEQVFVERGIYATHMAEIAARAGVAVGTLYNHYKDREALVNALATERRIKLLERIDDCLNASEGQPFFAQLTALLRVVYTHFEEHWQFFATFTQAECGPPNMSQTAQEIQREIYFRCAQLVERGQKQGELRAELCPLAPTLLMGMMRSMLMRRMYLPEEGSAVQHIDLLVSFFISGAGEKAK